MPSAPADLLVAPAFLTHPDYASTLGPEVGELAALAHFGPDPEQQLLLDPMFGMDRAGHRVAFEAACIGARQNIKTGLFKIAAIGKVWLLEQDLFVWSAHEFSTTQEAFRDLDAMIEGSEELSRQVLKIHRGNGDEAIELKHGGRIKFKARTKSGGRGLTGDAVCLDEAFALQPAHMGALLPLLSTRPEAQVLYGSSAGLATSAVLRSIRDRGRRPGGDRALVYAEWTSERADGSRPPCAVDGCDHELHRKGCALDDREVIQLGNPQAGRRITWDYLEDERRALPPAEYGRERAGWWDAPADEAPPAIDLDDWTACGDRKAERPTTACIVVDVSPDRRHAAIAVVGGDSEKPVGLVKQFKGTADVVPAVKKLLKKLDVLEVALAPHSGAGVLLAELVALDYRLPGGEVYKVNGTERGRACGAFITRVQDGRFVHVKQPEVDAAIANARTRMVGEVEQFDRREQGGPDICPAVALSIAAFRWSELDSTDYDVEDSYL